jgi:hypothetical protein
MKLTGKSEFQRGFALKQKYDEEGNEQDLKDAVSAFENSLSISKYHESFSNLADIYISHLKMSEKGEALLRKGSECGDFYSTLHLARIYEKCFYTLEMANNFYKKALKMVRCYKNQKEERQNLELEYGVFLLEIFIYRNQERHEGWEWEEEYLLAKSLLENHIVANGLKRVLSKIICQNEDEYVNLSLSTVEFLAEPAYLEAMLIFAKEYEARGKNEKANDFLLLAIDVAYHSPKFSNEEYFHFQLELAKFHLRQGEEGNLEEAKDLIKFFCEEYSEEFNLFFQDLETNKDAQLVFHFCVQEKLIPSSPRDEAIIHFKVQGCTILFHVTARQKAPDSPAVRAAMDPQLARYPSGDPQSGLSSGDHAMPQAHGADHLDENVVVSIQEEQDIPESEPFMEISTTSISKKRNFKEMMESEDFLYSNFPDPNEIPVYDFE